MNNPDGFLAKPFNNSPFQFNFHPAKATESFFFLKTLPRNHECALGEVNGLFTLGLSLAVHWLFVILPFFNAAT